MTLSTTDSRFSYDGDASTTVFSFPRKVIEASHLKVYLYDEDDDSMSLQVLDTNYTFAGSGLTNGIYASATITFTTAPGTDKKVVIFRDPALTQEADFTGETNVLNALNRLADRVEMKLQRLDDRVDRAILLPDGDYAASWGNANAKADYASALLGFNASGVPIPSGGSSGDVAVSAAMTPVVQAATLDAAADAFDYSATGTNIARSPRERAGYDRPTAFDFIPASYHSAIIARTSSQDVTEYLQDFIDFLTANRARGAMQRGKFCTSADLTAASAFELEGAGIAHYHSQSAAVLDYGTGLFWVGGAGGKMLNVQPVDAADGRRIGASRIDGIAFFGNGGGAAIAEHGLYTESMCDSFVRVSVQETSSSAMTIHVASDLGEATVGQSNIVWLYFQQHTAGSGDGLVLSGIGTGETGNACFNDIWVPRGVYYNGVGLRFRSSDNNHIPRARLFRFGGSGTGVIFEGANDDAASCARDNRIGHLSPGAGGVIARGAATYTYPSTDNRIEWIDTENGASDPTVEANASLVWGDEHGADVYLGSRRNLLINGQFAFNQRQAATNADDTYSHDGWYALTQTDTVAVSTVSAPENGQPQCARLTQSQAVAQRMGYAQIVENSECMDLRGKGVALSGRVRLSATATVRFAVLEWTGTADSVTSDVVNDWTSATFTAGNFFNSTTLNVLATGSVACTANTWTHLSLLGSGSGSLTASVGSSANNLIVLIWTDAAAAQNVTLDLGSVQLEPGYQHTRYMKRPRVDELQRCQRRYQKSYAVATAPGTSTTVGAVNNNAHGAAQASRFHVALRTEMRTTPTPTVYSTTGASGNIRDLSGSADKTASTTAAGPSGFTAFPTENLTDNIIVGFHWVAEADL